MNYYQALEKVDKSGWHFTITNGGKARIHPCCFNCEPPHATKEEAEACFQKYLLERIRLDGKLSNQQLKCAECGEFTDGFAETQHGNMVILCDKHRTLKVYEKHWKPPTYIMSSY